MKHPVISISDLEVLKNTTHRDWKSHVIDVTFPASGGVSGFLEKLNEICEEAERAAKEHQIIILSDRLAGKDRVPISSLLALGKEVVIFIIILIS